MMGHMDKRATSAQTEEQLSFHKLAKALVQVPKSEIDTLLAKEKRARARKARAPGKISKK